MTVTTVAEYVQHENEDEAMERLLDPESRNGYFETEDRPKRDTRWGTTYIVANVLVLVFGVGSIINRDKKFFEHNSPEYLSDATHCSAGRSLMIEEVEESIDSPATMAAVILLGSAGAALTGFLYLMLLKHRAMAAVLVSVFSAAALFLGSAILTFFADNKSPEDSNSAVWSLIFGLLFLVLPCLAWNRLVLVSRLLKVGGEGLGANSALFSAVFFVGLGGVALIFLQAVFMAFSLTNGSVVPNLEGPHPCKWQVSTWGVFNASFSAVIMFWTAQIANQVNVFTIGGTIAQWYFSAPGSSTRGTTLRSLYYAFKPSFGSLCLAGAVMALINLARSVLHSLRRRFGVCCTVIFSVLLSWMETFTKFSTIRMALTGESFFDAAKGVRDLLVRNARDAYTVWWFPVFVLHTFSFVASVAWGFAVGGLSAAFGFSAPTIAGYISGLLALICLSYVSSIVLSAVDTVFICWVMDCDRKTVTRVEVHEVFQEMPLAKPTGIAVEQPDGSFGYAPPSVAENTLNPPMEPPARV